MRNQLKADVYFSRELMEAFTDAKVVLTTRNPETWYSSVRNTIFGVDVWMRTSLIFRIFTAIIGIRKQFEIAIGHSYVVHQGCTEST